MVKAALTMFGRVNNHGDAESNYERGREMKKPAHKGFWTWLLGGGWSGGAPQG
jgi:hypothetical protein